MKDIFEKNTHFFIVLVHNLQTRSGQGSVNSVDNLFCLGPPVASRAAVDTTPPRVALAATAAVLSCPEPLHNRLQDMEARIFRDNRPLPPDLYAR